LLSEFDKVFLKYIGINLEKYVMKKKEKKENEKKLDLPSAPGLALGKLLHYRVSDLGHSTNPHSYTPHPAAHSHTRALPPAPHTHTGTPDPGRRRRPLPPAAKTEVVCNPTS